MGGTIPKQFLQIGGREILARTLEVFRFERACEVPEGAGASDHGVPPA